MSPPPLTGLGKILRSPYMVAPGLGKISVSPLYLGSGIKRYQILPLFILGLRLIVFRWIPICELVS